MKRAAALGVVVLATVTSARGDDRPGRGHALPATPRTSATAAGVVVLRAPSEGEVSFPETLFEMGSAPTEIPEAIALCEREVPPALCELPMVREGMHLEDLLSNELAMHEVALSAFAIDRTEVTVAAYRRCADVGACSAQPIALAGKDTAQPDFPATMVTWADARAFCQWAGKRLPTEAEWERAARGAAGRRFPWGGSYHPSLANHGVLARTPSSPNAAVPEPFSLRPDVDASDGFAALAPVGSFPDGATPEGIVDLAGNVAEWTEDGYEERFEPASVVNPVGSAASPYKVLRGGSFLHGASFLRGSARLPGIPGAREPWVGFRCARTL